MEQKAAFSKIRKTLHDKMTNKYENLEDFLKRSGIQLSRETCRRILYDGLPINIPSLIMLTKYLGFTSKEIAQIIKDVGDTEFHPLLDKSSKANEIMSADEKAVVEIVRALKAKDYNSMNALAAALTLVAAGTGINIKDQLRHLKISKRGGNKDGNLQN